MKEYKNRIADQILADKLEAMGAVLIEGPKYCGKTTLATQQAKSILYMADPDTKSQNLAMAQTNIKRLLQGETPRLIDEWQLAPQFWDAVRNEVDKRDEDGQFMLTGSAVPPKQDEIFHSGAGRMSWLKLRTMSLWESGDSSGDVSLGALFNNADTVDGTSKIDIDELAFLTCRGGWPKATLKKSKKAALL
ncbi:MAG: AAA family ATPase, partial [Bacilli bacterium]|nr:AAA family ATPase [Bacilli bacterium]